MKRLLLLFAMLLLVACGAAEPDEFSSANNAAPADTAVSAPAADTGGETAVDLADSPVQPASSPAEAAVVRSRDWTLGATEPAVSIIEYGDFQ
ncbi:MAG: hypothetical protein KC425_01765 [Anaerolineales bacterium]|nr:hypothetical protein [Anaerolineales bacterium]